MYGLWILKDFFWKFYDAFEQGSVWKNYFYWIIEVFTIILWEMSVKSNDRMLKDVLRRMIFSPDI